MDLAEEKQLPIQLVFQEEALAAEDSAVLSLKQLIILIFITRALPGFSSDLSVISGEFSGAVLRIGLLIWAGADRLRSSSASASFFFLSFSIISSRLFSERRLPTLGKNFSGSIVSFSGTKPVSLAFIRSNFPSFFGFSASTDLFSLHSSLNSA